MTKENQSAINIVIDWRKSNEPVFVEIENDEGKSIRIGEQIPDGPYVKIRITADDIIKHPKCGGIVTEDDLASERAKDEKALKRAEYMGRFGDL